MRAGAVYFLLPLSMGGASHRDAVPGGGAAAGGGVAGVPRSFPAVAPVAAAHGVRGAGGGLLVLGTILTLMGIRAAHHPRWSRPVTVIVLGCQVRSDGTPSRMLRDRIQAAYDYLSVHEEAVCVASGGQNDREPTTEARCIRDTLVAMGIDPDRIYPEDASTSTEENLAFSAEVIRREGLPTEVAIASDNFHQLRAGVWAEKDGLTPYSPGLRQHLDAWPRLLGQGGRRSVVYGCDRRTVMELYFTGISVEKGYPGGKAVGIPLRGEKSFATQRHFSELQEVLKMEIIIVQDTLPGFPHTPFRPVGERLSLWGQTQGIPAAKPPGYLFAWRKVFSPRRGIFQSFKKF